MKVFYTRGHVYMSRLWKPNLGALDSPGWHNHSRATSLPHSYILHSTLRFPYNTSISTHIHHQWTQKKEEKKKQRRISKKLQSQTQWRTQTKQNIHTLIIIKLFTILYPLPTYRYITSNHIPHPKYITKRQHTLKTQKTTRQHMLKTQNTTKQNQTTKQDYK